MHVLNVNTVGTQALHLARSAPHPTQPSALPALVLCAALAFAPPSS
jgi:hypothetical protein